MAEPVKFHKVTAKIHREISGRVLAGLKEIGVHDIGVTNARALVILESRGLFGRRATNGLVGTPLEIITFLVPPEVSDSVLNLVIDLGDLTVQGRGSAHVEEVTVPAAHDIFQETAPPSIDPDKQGRALQLLQKVCCIVQRGQGTGIAKVALYTGAGVPAIYYGTGTGVRDKMGLLRITIPADKEIVAVSTTPHNAELIMDMMIEAGQLNQPGKGFIYTHMLKKGIVDLQVSRGDRRHAATIEQIVAAIDQMQGDTVWRRWAGAETRSKYKRRRYWSDLVDLTLFCNAGTGGELVRAAMDEGVSGATIHTLRHVCPAESPLSGIGLSRDVCSMVVPSEVAPRAVQAVEAAGAFTDRCFGQVQIRHIRKAYTYFPEQN